jgi:hypothetical protein
MSTSPKLHRKSKAVTGYKEFLDRPHFTVGAPGWEEVAEYALSWAALVFSLACAAVDGL